MMNLYDAFRGQVLNGEASMGMPLGKVILGAMSPGAALQQLSGQVTLICPIDREDVLVAALAAMYISGRKDFTLASLVITGQGKLTETVLRMIRRTTIPVLHVEPDAYTVISQVHAANFKMSPTDTEKVAKSNDLVRKQVDIEAIVRGLQE
jgi:BioD-like phosphotransacetylase family protein